MSDRPRITIRPDHIEPLGDVDDARVFAAGEMYHLMNAAIAPRPVAWVSTIDSDGTPNLAPHSYTTIFSTNPAVVGFVSVGRKDSLNNAEATREFVLNIASLSLIEHLNTTAADFPPSEDEFDWAGLTHVPSDVVRPPRVGEAPVSFETKVRDIIPIGNCFLILGEVVRVHVATDVWSDGRIDPTLLDPILRLAGSMFAHLGETFEIPRPTYRDVLARQQADEGDAS
jgi:flavin reductase (DIM6/NTAB) family NADH-FMN oxidoreductase RutF